jgi:hypothetical protein
LNLAFRAKILNLRIVELGGSSLGLRLYAIALLLISGTVFATDVPFEIKGLTIGNVIDCTTLDDIDVRSGTFYGRSTPDSCWSEEDKIGWKTLEVSFLGKSDQPVMFGVRPDGIMSVIYITSESGRYGGIPWTYDDAVTAFTEKYGEPDEVTASVGQNAYGAEFPQRSAIWKNGSQILQVGENLSKVGQHSVKLSDPTLLWKSKASDDI